jgi:hypothetical protein
MDEIIRVLKGISAMTFAIYLVVFAGLLATGSGGTTSWIVGL